MSPKSVQNRKKGDWGKKKRGKISKNEQTKHGRAPDTQETGL